MLLGDGTDVAVFFLLIYKFYHETRVSKLTVVYSTSIKAGLLISDVL